MTVLEAIETRISRRTYTNAQVPEALAEALNSDISHLNRLAGLSLRLIPDGSGAFARLTKSYGLLSGVKSMFSMAGPENDPFLYEKIGYYGEFLVLAATRLGLSTCWVGGTFDKDYPLCELLPSEKQACVVTVGFAPTDLTGKEKLILQAVRRKNLPLEFLYTADAPPPDWFLAGMRAVSKAPSARNLQPARFLWQNNTVLAQNDARFAFQKIDLGIAKAHFALGAGGRFEPGRQSAFRKENHPLAAWPFMV